MVLLNCYCREREELEGFAISGNIEACCIVLHMFVFISFFHFN